MSENQVEATLRAADVMPAAEQIDKFWWVLERCWNIEPREYFEREAPKNGFGSPLAMAVHYMWKRKTKAPSYVANCHSCGAKVGLVPEPEKA